MVVQNNVRRFN